MKKTAVALTSFVFVLTLGFGLSAGAASLGSCKTTAGQSRYDIETQCYETEGPKSGKWSASDRSALDLCLNSAGKQYTAEVNACRQMYMAAGDTRPHFENAEALVTTVIGLSVGLFLLMAL